MGECGAVWLYASGVGKTGQHCLAGVGLGDNEKLSFGLGF